MPRSRSRSLLSMTRSATCWLARNAPLWRREGVDEGGLAVVDVRDDGDVAAERVGDRQGLAVHRHPVSAPAALVTLVEQERIRQDTALARRPAGECSPAACRRPNEPGLTGWSWHALPDTLTA